MKKIKLLLALASILLLAVSVVAQDEEEEDEGRWRYFEVNVTGGFTQPGSFLTDWEDTLGAKLGFNLALSSAYFLTNNFGVGLYFTYSQLSIDANWDQKFKMYDFGGYLKYALVGESSFEPYAKLSLGVIVPKYPTWIPPDARNQLREQSYDAGLNAALYAGLLFYTSESGGIYAEVGYHNAFIKDAYSEYADRVIGDDVNYFEFRVGVSVYFGPEE